MRISGLVALLFDTFYVILFIRVIMSWLPQRTYGSRLSRFGQVVYDLTEPVLRPVRRALWRYQGGMQIDFSPLAVILAISLLRTIIVSQLVRLGL